MTLCNIKWDRHPSFSQRGSYKNSGHDPCMRSQNVVVRVFLNILPPFQNKVTFGHKLRYKIKVTFGKISLKLCQTNWNVAIINVNVVVDELPSQIKFYTFLTIDIWTQRRWHTSTRFYKLRCHPHKMVGLQTNWCQKLSTLLWTPSARQIALSESHAMHIISC